MIKQLLTLFALIGILTIGLALLDGLEVATGRKHIECHFKNQPITGGGYDFRSIKQRFTTDN